MLEILTHPLFTLAVGTLGGLAVGGAIGFVIGLVAGMAAPTSEET